MSTALTRPAHVELALEQLVAGAASYAANARASATRKAYVTDWQLFETWCAARHLPSMPAPPQVIALYLTSLADEQAQRPSTLKRKLTSIAHAHRSQGFPWQKSDPLICEVMSGIARRHGIAPRQKAPVCAPELAALVAPLGTGLRDLRDRAILLVGWAGAYRRSELVSLDVEDIGRQATLGLVATLRRSKTDQEGAGTKKGIPYAKDPNLCPVRALDAWLAASGIPSGPIFREIDRHGRLRARLTPGSVALIVKRAALRAGLDPRNLSGHSLRAGLVTTAAKHGKSSDAIMRQTNQSCEKVMRTYIRHALVFDDNAADGLV
jgi:integrase